MFSLIALVMSAQEIKLEGSFNKSESNGKGGTVLSWERTKEDSAFTVYQKKKGEREWNTISTFQKGQTIKVLNVYPSDKRCGYTINLYWVPVNNVKYIYSNGQEETKPKSAMLKIWMEGGKYIEYGKLHTFEPAGFSKEENRQLIFVDTMDVCKFETDPNVIFNYDCFLFGTWDSSAAEEISDKSADVVNEFLDRGGGVIVGHDAVSYRFGDHGLGKIRKRFGIEYINSSQSRTTQAEICKKGIITNYPHQIGDVGKVFNIPLTHTFSQRAHGTVWMKLKDNYYDSIPLSDSAYISTLNNTALIQTGHSNCESNENERKLIANLIYYLSQKTINTSFVDHSSQDLEKPVLKLSYSNEPFKIVWSGEDKGSIYLFKVNEFSNKYSTNLISESNTIEIQAKSGIKEYLYKISNDKNEKLYNINDKTFIHTTSNEYKFKSYEVGKYFHLSAIDYSENIADTVSIQIPPFPTQSPLPPQVLDNLFNANVNQKLSKNAQNLIVAAAAGAIALVALTSFLLYKKFTKIEADFELQVKNGLNVDNSKVNYENPLYDKNGDVDPFKDDFE